MNGFPDDFGDLGDILSRVMGRFPSSFTITDKNGIIRYVNPQFEMSTGFTKEEVVGQDHNILNSGTNKEGTYEDLWNTILRGESWHGELCNKKKDGSLIWEEITISSICGDDGQITHFVEFKIDTTERRRHEETLRESEKRYRELSITDDLTQLYNTRYFYDQLGAEVNRVNRYPQSLSILLLDIDNFKVFNDTYGHVDGNQVLARLGRIIKKCLREVDSGYRYGGEEFTVLLPVTTLRGGITLAEKIRKEFKSEVFTTSTGKKVSVTISVGVAEYSLGEDLDTFVRRADKYMYDAKHSGKDRVLPDVSQ